MSPKAYIAVALALLAGLILGSWVPQADLRQARRQLAEAQRGSPARQPTRVGAAIAGVQSILKADEGGSAPSRREHRHTPEPASAPAPAASPGALAAGTPAANTQALAQVPAPTQTVARLAFTNQIDKIREGWIARSQIARANFISRSEMDAQQTADFDAVVAGMNLRLGAAIDNWVARVSAQGQVTSEDGVRILNEVSTALVLSYDAMDRYLPGDWREKAGPRFELVNFADPEVLAPLQDVEGLLNQASAESGAGQRHDFGAHFEAGANAPPP